LIFRSSIFARVGVNALVALVALWAAVVTFAARDGFKQWIVLKDCRLVANPANDGDSFHVSAGANEYIFRLYLVDTPETDEMTPGRLVEQAKYFGISVPQAIETGRAATDFTREKLSEPFTVFTHMSDAMGQSRLERFYAFVQTKEGDLGEQLVRNGLARIYGFKAAPPGLRNLRVEMEKLQQLENEARLEKIGGWGIGAGRLNARPERATSFSHFVLGAEVRLGATPPVNSTARVFPTSTPSTSRADGDQKSPRKEKTPLGKIDINTATEKELTTVPGIGHVMAARIIAARPFRSADDLRRVSGIGDKKYA
jgi:DNA uptake protein ComE-like DNA-binding protein